MEAQKRLLRRKGACLLALLLVICLLGVAEGSNARGARGDPASASASDQIRFGKRRTIVSDEENPPCPGAEWERRILEVLEELEGLRGFFNVPGRDGRLLRLLVEAVNAKKVVEIGTSNGL